MVSFDTALQYNVTAVETDISLTADGVLYLMHDATLERTTDVRKIFPDNVTAGLSHFTADQLDQLHAGDWFLQVRFLIPVLILQVLIFIVLNLSLIIVLD